MTDHLEALERLQRLREAGTLTEAEFAAEKTRILGGADMPAARVEGASVEDQDPTPRRRWFLAGGALVLVGGAATAAMWLGASVVPGPADSGKAPTANVAAAQPVAAPASVANPAEKPVQIMLGDTPQDRNTLIEAFDEAFAEDGVKIGTGQATMTIDDGAYDFEPVALYDLGGSRYALLSLGAMTDPGHSSQGINAIHYLQGGEGGYRVTGKYLNLGAVGTVGNAATSWTLTRALGPHPVLLTDGGGTWQGCTITTTALTELAPGGPRDIGRFHSASTSGAGAPVLDQDEYNYEGRITAAAPGKSFTVTYTGSRRFTEQYVRGRDGKYKLMGKSRLPTC